MEWVAPWSVAILGAIAGWGIYTDSKKERKRLLGYSEEMNTMKTNKSCRFLSCNGCYAPKEYTWKSVK